MTRAGASAAGRFACDGFTTVYDGMVGPWFLPTFADAAGLDELSYVIVLPDVDQCVARVATREGHGFADLAATRKMHAEFRESPDRPSATSCSTRPVSQRTSPTSSTTRHRDGLLTYPRS